MTLGIDWGGGDHRIIIIWNYQMDKEKGKYVLIYKDKCYNIASNI